jgi:hypothetical protein
MLDTLAGLNAGQAVDQSGLSIRAKLRRKEPLDEKLLDHGAPGPTPGA